MRSRHPAVFRSVRLALLCCALASQVAWARLTGGPLLGAVTSRTASLWVQADAAAEMLVEYAQDAGKPRRSVAVPLREAEDFCGRVELTGLSPDTPVRYTIRLDGQAAYSGEFRTLPLWSRPAPPPELMVYLGSGVELSETQAPDAGALDSIARAAAGQPRASLMLWLGDHVRFDEADLESPWAMNARYRQIRSHPAARALWPALPHYATWGERDYGPENGNRAFVFKDASRQLFRRYWPNPSHGLEEIPGAFTRFSRFDVDFFLLDNRTYRAGDATMEPESPGFWSDLKDMALGGNQWTRLLGRRYLGGDSQWAGENKTLFGDAQMDWLKQSLIASRATFKIVVSGSQLLNDAGAAEGWLHYPRERGDFLEWLERQNLPGVFFVSGNRGHTELLRRARGNHYPLYELSCSPLAAPPRLPEDELENPQRVEGALVNRRNYCTLLLSGPPEDRQLLLRSHDEEGRVLWEHGLRARELSTE